MAKTVSNPIIPIRHSITVHIWNVCLMLTLKNSLNIQNPTSLKCENIRLPEPVASTINSGFTPLAITIGSIMPAAVIVDTVADPIANRNNAATTHDMMIGLKFIPMVTFLI